MPGPDPRHFVGQVYEFTVNPVSPLPWPDPQRLPSRGISSPITSLLRNPMKLHEFIDWEKFHSVQRSVVPMTWRFSNLDLA